MSGCFFVDSSLQRPLFLVAEQESFWRLHVLFVLSFPSFLCFFSSFTLLFHAFFLFAGWHLCPENLMNAIFRFWVASFQCWMLDADVEASSLRAQHWPSASCPNKTRPKWKNHWPFTTSNETCIKLRRLHRPFTAYSVVCPLDRSGKEKAKTKSGTRNMFFQDPKACWDEERKKRNHKHDGIKVWWKRRNGNINYNL